MPQCVYVSWFHFQKKCSITTCKYHSLVVPTRCIAIHHHQSVNKPFTDDELRYYKFPHTTSLKMVSIKRKKAINDAKMLLALYNYLTYLEGLLPHFQENHPLPGNWEVSLQLTTFVASFPLHLAQKKYLPFVVEMLPLLLDEEIYQSYLVSVNGEAKSYTLFNLLSLTVTRLQLLARELKMLQKQTGLFLPAILRNSELTQTNPTWSVPDEI